VGASDPQYNVVTDALLTEQTT